MFPANNVVDLVGKSGVVFVDEAVFAAMIRAASYFNSEPLTDISGYQKEFGAPWP
jgi:hypothetical protein